LKQTPIVLSFILAAGCAAGPTPAPSEDRNHFAALYEALHRPSLPFRILAKDVPSVRGPIGAIRTLEVWQAAYHQPDVQYGSIPAQPPVDFAKEQIVVLHFQAGSNIDSNEIAGVEEQAEGLLVRPLQWQPDPGGPPMTSAENFFYEAIAIPQSTKPLVLGQLLVGYIGERARMFDEPTQSTKAHEVPALPLSAPLYPTVPGASPSPR
jgi:hypothetical protein